MGPGGLDPELELIFVKFCEVLKCCSFFPAMKLMRVYSTNFYIVSVGSLLGLADVSIAGRPDLGEAS